MTVQNSDVSPTYPLSPWYFKAGSSALWSYNLTIMCLHVFVFWVFLYRWSTFSLRLLIFIFLKSSSYYFFKYFLSSIYFSIWDFYCMYLTLLFSLLIEVSINDFQPLKLPWCPSQSFFISLLLNSSCSKSTLLYNTFISIYILFAVYPLDFSLHLLDFLFMSPKSSLTFLKDTYNAVF